MTKDNFFSAILLSITQPFIWAKTFFGGYRHFNGIFIIRPLFGCINIGYLSPVTICSVASADEETCKIKMIPAGKWVQFGENKMLNKTLRTEEGDFFFLLSSIFSFHCISFLSFFQRKEICFAQPSRLLINWTQCILT